MSLVIMALREMASEEMASTLVEITLAVISLVSLCPYQPHIHLITLHITHLLLSFTIQC